MARILIGIVGYCQFVQGYPLGPGLMARLQALAWPEPVDIRELNWSPIAIVQDFQASAQKYERVVLVGAVDRCLEAGTVNWRRWQGRPQDLQAVQGRVFEAVTGVVGLDNLLVIGAHFGVWPGQLATVEVQLADSSLADLVLAEIEAARWAARPPVIGQQALSRDDLNLVERIVQICRQAVLATADAGPGPQSLAALDAAGVAPVCHYDFMDQGGGSPPRDGQEQAP